MKESIEKIITDMLKWKSANAIEECVNRIELLFKTELRQERIKADWLRSRYEKGLPI
jgi:hypothetical protein